MKYSPRESTIIDVADRLRGEIMSLAIKNDIDLWAGNLLKEVNPEAFDKLLENWMRFTDAWCRPDPDMPRAARKWVHSKRAVGAFEEKRGEVRGELDARHKNAPPVYRKLQHEHHTKFLTA